jgi:hypothetical protein
LSGRGRLTLRSLSDDDLLRRLSEAVRRSRRIEADLVALIGEVEARRLYAREASPSMFAYCTEELHLSEPEAILRIRVARASRQHPMLLTMLRDGRLHLSGIALLAPLLTSKNRAKLLKRATHKSKQEIRELVAELAPRPDAPSVVRKLPARPGPEAAAAGGPLCPDTVGAGKSLVCGNLAEPMRETPDLLVALSVQRPGSVVSAGPGLRSDSVSLPAPRLRPDTVALVPPRPATVEPLAASRFKVQFTASAELRDKLQRLQALMRSSVPDGDLAAIIDAAVTEKLERLEAKRLAKTKYPRKALEQTDTTPTSRHIPAPVRRAVHARDKGRCTYVDKQGRRCRARDRLEFHHHAPFGRGGDHSLGNIRLMCRCHNVLLAEGDYGKETMARHRRSGKRASGSAMVCRAGHRGVGADSRPPP